VTNGEPTYVTYLRNKETLPAFFFLAKFCHLLTKKDLPKFYNSVNWKKHLDLRQSFQATKLQKKNLEPCCHVEMCFLFLQFFALWRHIFLGKLGGFWKTSAISIEFGDFRIHVAIYWKTNQQVARGLNFFF
jgi:hypothetical protein